MRMAVRPNPPYARIPAPIEFVEFVFTRYEMKALFFVPLHFSHYRYLSSKTATDQRMATNFNPMVHVACTYRADAASAHCG